jgi:hypothetical protein
MIPRPFPPALPHGEITEVLPNVFFVTGAIGVRALVTMRFSRNMTVIREGGRLVLVNSVRLNEAGLAQLDALGTVSDVIRLAGFHGADDAFYKDRYGAKVWAIKGQRYTAGFDVHAVETHFEPDAEIDARTVLPLGDASVYLFSTRPPEALLILAREGGLVVSGDALQHWATVDPYFNWFGGLLMKRMGFIKPHNVGPAWLKQAKPAVSDLRGVLELEFEHLLPAHGAPVLGGAKSAFRPAIERAISAQGR